MATVTYVIDPLNILTMGIISGNPLTLITDGFVTVEIEEEIIEEDGDAGAGDFDHLRPWDVHDQQQKERLRR